MITTKQRAYLRKLSHDLEPIFQVGKSGVTPEIIQAIDDALEARELIKLTVLKNCEEDVRSICDTIAARTHSDPVIVIGHKFTLYRAAKKPQIELPKVSKNKMENQDTLRKIAVMGGTFDPIHYGHLVTAEAVMHEYDIDQVLFIPSGQPPHKAGKQVTSANHRFLMTLMATETNPNFFSSRIEIDRKGYTYTIDTIQQLKELNPGVEIYFITGADAFSEILTWKDPEVLLSSCHFVAATRPGYSRKKAAPQIEAIVDRHVRSLHYLEVPALTISSSDIRQRVREGRPIKYLLPETVENYIYKHGLYQPQ